MADTQKYNGTECMQARLMRHCYIVFLWFFLPHKPHLHALGPIVLHVSTIYEYGVYQQMFLDNYSIHLPSLRIVLEFRLGEG